MTEAEDKEKAEKLAAAKKRFEQLKKQKESKGKKAATKKKTDKAEPEAEAGPTTEKADDTTDEPRAAEKDEDILAETAGLPQEPEEATPPYDSSRPPHGRQPSISIQSKLRSESFRRGSSSQDPASPIGALRSPTFSPTSPAGEGAHEVFQKQAQRIEELERENRRLATESQEAVARRRKIEEELEELREASAEVAELRCRASEADERKEELEKLKAELASLERQNAHLQSQASKSLRRVSSSSPASTDDLAAQLASKASTIENLELTISNLRTQLSASVTLTTDQAVDITALEASLERATQAADSSARELAEVKSTLNAATSRTTDEDTSLTSAASRIAQLEAELEAAHRTADDATKRAATLERKVEALTSLHREADARNQGRLRDAEIQEREVRDLRSQLAALRNENERLRDAGERHRKAAAAHGGNIFGDEEAVDELEDEERVGLRNKVRELEDEVFDLRRGVWRDRRREMQPDPTASDFDEVDLSGSASPPRRDQAAREVVSRTSLVAASARLRGRRGRKPSQGVARQPQQQQRKQSLGLLSEDADFAFDEDAFRVAQEEEARKRVERAREVKRG
ncbi:hypothetical protein H2199_006745 [Coniosporium tulheliwenetii]|uniref:Uncharacterized protein n=1 Tax=Coniosporium tulheliwenetii TaxID=3383036 RepID=A0ACC2YU96_9PEZI|nr:hypothetical protein H2199_006745 [Cladosporium sp. JES 115]